MPQKSRDMSERRKRRELIVDTRGSYFLCLEETVASSEEVCSMQSGLRDVSFRNICRYLKMNQSKILTQAFDLKSEKGSNCDLSVLLCPECAFLTQELSQFVRQMEVIKMLMGQHLQTFENILTESQVKEESADAPNRTSRWAKLEAKLMEAANEDDSVAHARLVMGLRNDTIEKCSAKLAQLQQTSAPKVLLERCDLWVVTNNVKNNSIKNYHSSSGHPRQQTWHNVGPGSQSTKTVVAVAREHLDEIESRHLELKPVYNKKCEGKNRRCTYNLCDNPILCSDVEPHVLRHQPEKFFVDGVLPDVSEANFKDLYISVQSSETDMCSDTSNEMVSRRRAGERHENCQSGLIMVEVAAKNKESEECLDDINTMWKIKKAAVEKSANICRGGHDTGAIFRDASASSHRGSKFPGGKIGGTRCQRACPDVARFQPSGDAKEKLSVPHPLTKLSPLSSTLQQNFRLGCGSISETVTETGSQKKNKGGGQSFRENRAENSKKETGTKRRINFTMKTKAFDCRHNASKTIPNELNTMTVVAQKKETLVGGRSIKKLRSCSGRNFPNRSSKSENVTPAHRKRFVCSKCGHKFTLKTNFKQHIQAVHEKQRPHECQVCSKTFFLACTLNVHMRRHAGEKPHSCSKCPMKFFSKQIMKIHEISQHTDKCGKKITCNLCGKLFRTQANLSSHRKRMHTDGTHACIFCEKVFTYKTQMWLHLYSHIEEKWHFCNICGREFTQYAPLSQHMRVHTGEKPYKCQVCQQAFRYTSSLNYHMARHCQLEKSK